VEYSKEIEPIVTGRIPMIEKRKQQHSEKERRKKKRNSQKILIVIGSLIEMKDYD
jgi:hypothetical protein